MGLKILFAVVAGIALLTALTLWRAARNEARAEASHPPEGQLLSVNGYQVHAVVMGEGPDLVLIHGSSGNTRDMTFSLAPALAERYRVIVIDRPGLGYTERMSESGATLRQQAELLADTARQLGAEKPIVMGQSYGGAVALAWAVYLPDRLSALAPLAAPSNPWTTPLDPFYQVTSSWWGKMFVVPLITAFVSEARVARTIESVFEPQIAPEGYAQHFGPGLTLRRASLRANAMHRANIKGEIIDMHTQYDRVIVPTEILHGTVDTTVGLPIHSALLVNQIDGAVLTPLDGIGHMPQHVAQSDVIAGIDRAAARAGLR
ncbi:MAG: alpha/beta fold hydrolase [Arenibacterium sp.]